MCVPVIPFHTIRPIIQFIAVLLYCFTKEHIMSKAQDSKKAVKKEPAKTMKEKKADKKVKKEAMKRQ